MFVKKLGCPNSRTRYATYNLQAADANKRYEKYFGLTAKQFGDNLVADYLANAPERLEEEPDTVAQDFVDKFAQPSFSTAADVLKGTARSYCNLLLAHSTTCPAARYLLAQEIAYDPHVRQSLRSTYRGRAVVSTKPTPKGLQEITTEHMYRVCASRSRLV